MKNKFRIISIIFTLLVLLFANFSFVFAEEIEPNLSANAVILIDNKTNKILYKKNENERIYPASTTKILTAIIVLESCNLDDIVTASYDAIMAIPKGYSSANIQINEQFTVEQLLQLLLIHSANDAATVLAEYVGGSVDSFVAIMNTKSNELGLENSNFTNPYGKHDDNHYTTAYDMAKLLQYCLKNETFRKISGSASCAIPATNKSGNRLYNSTNELLIANNRNYYQYLTTGKTGYTSQAKECLISSAYKDDLELIGAIFGSSNRFQDTRSLYQYGYSNYLIKTVMKQNDVGTKITVSNGTKNTKNLDLLVKDNINILIKSENQDINFEPEIILNKKISAPITENDVLGQIKYEIDGIEYTSDLIASHNVDKSKILNYTLYSGFALVLLFIAYELLNNKNKKIRK